MKKLLVISLAVLLATLLVVSCSSEQKIEDSLALVSFRADEKTGRSLTRTNPILDTEAFFWSYTATKTDSTGLTMGSVSTPKAVKAGKGLAAVGPFSYGEWSFTLYGYADECRENLVYSGTSALTVNKATNTLTITVESKQSAGVSGYLDFPAKGDIALTGGGSTAVNYSSLIEEITIKRVDGTEQDNIVLYDYINTEGKNGLRRKAILSGSYSVTFAYWQGATLSTVENTTTRSGGYVVAEETIYVAIADYLTTTIGGDVASNTGSVEFKVENGIVEVTKVATINKDATTEIKIEAPAESGEGTASEEIMTISVPAGAISAESVTTKATSYTREAVAATKPTFVIQDTGTSTATEAAVLGGLDLDIYVGNSTEKLTDFSGEDKALTITTYIAKNLNQDDIVVKYDGPANADGSAKSDGKVTSYEPTTGKLVFTVDHLSSYYFVSKSAVVFNSTTQAVYSTLKAAVEAVNSGDKLVLLKNIDNLAETINVKKSFSLDLNGKTINATSRVFLIHGGAVSIDNGTIEASVSNETSSVIRVSCNDNCTDATEAISLTIGSKAIINGTSSYGVTAFGKKDATVNVYGKIESANAALAGNGDTKAGYEGKFILNVYDGAVLTANGSSGTYTDAAGIYQPDGDTVLNIYGGTVTSASFSAVEIRAGKANISGGNLVSSASEYSCTSATSGPTTKGVAIAVAPYYGDTEVAISGGTFSAKKVLAVVNPQELALEKTKTVKAVVKNGVIISSFEGFDADISEGKAYFIDMNSAAENGVGVEAKIGDTYYKTVNDAIQAASEGATITILDCSASNNVPDEDVSKYTWEVIHNNCGDVADGYWHEKSNNFEAGYGTKVEPYMISTKEQFQNVSEMYEKYAYYKISNEYSELDLSNWKSADITGSFDGNNKHFINVPSGLFRYVGYSSNETITLKNIEVTFDSSSYGIACYIDNTGTTIFNNVKVHGTLEFYWNSGSFFSYGREKSFTVNFVNSTSDATLNCLVSTVGGFAGHPYEGSGNSFTMNIDENSKYTGTIYSKNGDGNKYIGMCSNGKFCLNGTLVGYEKYDKVVKITEVKPELKEGNDYVIKVDSNASKLVYSVDAQLDGYNEDNTTVSPNMSGITMVLDMNEVSSPSSEITLLENVTSATITNGADDYGYNLSNGVMEVLVPGNYNYRSGTIRLTVTQYNSDGGILCTGTTDVFKITNPTV